MAELTVEASKGRLEGLRALRDVLAATIESAGPEQTAALARQLRDVLGDIDALERAKGRKGSLVDELADRRKARGSDAEGVAGSGGGS